MSGRAPRLSEVAIEPLGDGALMVRFGDRVDAELNRLVLALDAALRATRPAWLVDLVPAYATLALYLDPAQCAAGEDAHARAEDWVRAQLAGMSSTRAPGAAHTVEIPVHYGGEDGPDLEALAAHARLAVDVVVARHAAVEYRVAMLGFAPGFPYLIGLDPSLAMPRLAQPRARIAAGSVAIGGAQTGVYPRPGPAGWRIIGRTALALFDPARTPPSLLQPGDRVRFVPVAALA